jgi:iron complex outermembrane receptor protein
VWSRGIEIASSTDFKYAGFKGYFKFGYNYTPSTFEGEDSRDGKQLIYTPLHKVSEVFNVRRGSYYALFTYSYTGKRYVQSDNSSSLPSYSLLDVFAGYIFKLKEMDIRTQFEIHNLFNTEYQSVLYYPEPGRTYSVNLLFSIH